MKHPQLRPWLLALTGAAAFTLVAPSSRADDKVIIEKRPVTRTTYHYIYYPEAEVYLVPETHMYIVREGDTFRSVSEVPPGISLGSSVNLDLDKPDPWTTHEVIVRKYGGKHGKVKTTETYKDEDGN